MPDLTHLKVYVVRLDDDEYRAGFVNAGARPPDLPADDRLDVLFEPFDRQRSAGLIELEPGALPIETWVASAGLMAGLSEFATSPPEVVEAVDRTRVAAGKRPSGQGIRLNAKERRAIELHAVELAVELLEDEGWSVEDVSLFRPYDLHCTRGENDLRVEVKGTTGDGSSILLTPGEVSHARDHHAILALIVVSGIELSPDPETGDPVAAGGTVDMTRPWEIDAEGELRPTGFEYRRA